MVLLTSPEQALWRSSPHRVTFDIYVHAPTVVFRAQINDPTHLLTPAFTALPYDNVSVGAYADVEAEMLVLIGSTAGADDLGRTRTRPVYPGKTVATGAALYIGRSSRGTNDGEIIPTDNAYITVLDCRAIFATPPYLDENYDPDNPRTLKDGEVVFDDTYCYEPVAIMGGDRLIIVDSPSDTYTFNYDWTGSYVTHPDASSITDYDADFGGVDTSTTDSGTVELPVGAHRIRLTITDDLGNTTTGVRRWVVADKAHANLLHGFEVKRHVERADGQDVVLRLSKPLPYATYPDGTEVLIRQREVYGGLSAESVGSIGILDDHEDMVFSGWLGQETNEGAASRSGFIGRTTLTLQDAAARLKSLPGFPQVVERRAAPTQWEHMQGATIDRYLYYLQRWHSNAAVFCDFIWSGTGDTYPFTTLGSDGQSLYEQIDKRAQAIGYKLTCDRHNRLIALGDPNILPSAAQVSAASSIYGVTLPTQRTSDVIVSVLESDWRNYSADFIRSPRVHWNWGEAIVASTNNADGGQDIETVFCVAPGAAPGQGLSEQRSGEQLVMPVKASGQVELNVRERNRYDARMNARYGLMTAEIRPGDAGLCPARMKWVQFTVSSATAAPRGRTLSAARFLPVEMNHTYDHEKGTRKTRLSLEPETTSALFAEDYYPPTDSAYVPPPSDYPPITFPPVTPGDGIGINAGTRYLTMVSTGNYLVLTSVFDAISPLWTATALSPSGDVIDAVQSAYTRTMFIVVTTHTDAIYTLTDVRGTPTLTLRKTLRAAISNQNLQWRMIDASFGANYIVVVSYYGNSGADSGVWYTYSTNGGVTWSTETQITAHYSSASGGAQFPGLFVSSRSPGVAYIGAYTASGLNAAAESDIYRTSGTFASPTAQSAGANDILPRCIHRSWADNENTMYWTVGNFAESVADRSHIYRKVGSAAREDITPTIGGNHQGLFLTRGLHTCPVDAATVLAAVAGNTTSGVVMSRDRGSNWTQISVGTTTSYNSAEVAGNNRDIGFVWGNDGAIGVVNLANAVMQSRIGNLYTDYPSVGRIVRIAGV